MLFQDKYKGPEMKPANPKRGYFQKYSTIFIIILCVFLIPMFSCVPETEVINLNDQIIALNKKVAKLEKAQAGGKGKGDIESELAPLRASQASSSADMEQIKGAIDAQSGRIEDMEHIVTRVIERDLSGVDEMRVPFQIGVLPF